MASACSVLASVWLMGCAAHRAPEAPKLPSLTLVDTAGASITFPDALSLAPLTVLVFYADHCPCFRAHESRVRELAARYFAKGVRFVVVDSERSASMERDREGAAQRGLPAIVLDPGARLADAVGAEYATFAVVLDREGRVHYRGGVDSDKNELHDDAGMFLQDALDALLAGREPRVAEGKVLGCALEKH